MTTPADPTYDLDFLADDAAALVELDTEEQERHYPGDRLTDTYKAAVLAQDEVTIDATQYVENAMQDEVGPGWGSAVVVTDASMARVNVSEPDMFVVDSMGNRIEGGRVMVTYRTVELDTP
ncbi:MAG: hypothetical protein EBY40_01165 [Marivivens sp.]|nr:hypothetical protein [Marivivens sp.]NBT50005.1 hypothetical protein [Marivivens sp.]NCW67389.1 hypothetical protein [Marivivens sp.]NDH01718.1 hypothetical protein [Marivivens sp.]